MPLLMCPNDSTAMQTLERSGVRFDMCPECRGVWLDRGELEKLMEAAAADGRASAPAAAPPPHQPAPQPSHQPSPWGGGGYRDERPRDGYRNDGYRGDDRYRGDDDHRYKKKKRDSIFDIFD